jgi:hypothetical protein
VLALCYYLWQPLDSTTGVGENKPLNSVNEIIPNIWFSHNKIYKNIIDINQPDSHCFEHTYYYCNNVLTIQIIIRMTCSNEQLEHFLLILLILGHILYPMVCEILFSNLYLDLTELEINYNYNSFW